MKSPKASKTKSGKWSVQIRLGDRRVRVTSFDKKDCELKAAAMKLEYQQKGQRYLSGDITLKEAVEGYISSRSNVLSPSTLRGYGIICRNRFQNIMDMKIKDVRSWQRVVNNESALVSPKTLKNSWGLISSVLKEYGCDPGPIRLPIVMPEDRAFLSPEDIKIFLAAIAGDPYELPYLLCLHGLRRSEMLALEKSDISEMIHVAKARVPGTDHRLVTKNVTKNRSSARSVPIFVSRLNGLVSDLPDGVLVKISPEDLNDHLREICCENNLPVVTLHGLRHSFASLCYHLNISELQCMELGGWSDLTTMRKIYTHVADADRKKALEDLRNFIGS